MGKTVEDTKGEGGVADDLVKSVVSLEANIEALNRLLRLLRRLLEAQLHRGKLTLTPLEAMMRYLGAPRAAAAGRRYDLYKDTIAF